MSDFSDASTGPLGYNLTDVLLGPSGEILVLDFDAGTDSRGALFRVDRT